MKISVVTPSYNQSNFIEETILSVMNQNYPHYEHIIIDGGSTDNTVSILKKYPHLKWVSEKDSGQSNAINKGFAMSSGDIISWINSDDYYEKNVFGFIIEYFIKNPDCMILYGDMTFVDINGNKLFSAEGDKINEERLMDCPDCVRQPSFFWRKQVMEVCGDIDEHLHLVMDFDFFLRIAKKFAFGYLNKNLSNLRVYSVSKTLSMPRRQVYEMYSVYKKNNITLTRKRLVFLLKKYIKSLRVVYRILLHFRGEGRV
ncbi:MAG: glycosyltransferase family 2 protein [Bacteroidota bacterium]